MSEPDVFDTEERKERLSELEKRLIGRHESDMRKVMSMVEGRRVIWRIMKECGVGRRDFFDSNALQMSKNSGSLNIGNFILERITPEEELRMKSEYRSDKLIQDTERATAERGTK